MTAEVPQLTPFERIGGEPAVRALAARFYGLMDGDAAYAALRAMHAPDLAPMRERLGDFLIGWLGGPPLYFQRSDAKCMGQAHAGFAIDATLRDQWLGCMNRAMQDCAVEDELQAQVRLVLARMAEGMRNR